MSTLTRCYNRLASLPAHLIKEEGLMLGMCVAFGSAAVVMGDGFAAGVAVGAAVPVVIETLDFIKK